MPVRSPDSPQRSFRGLNLTLFLPLITAVGVFLVARQAQTLPQGIVLGIGLAAALVAFVQWASGDLTRVALPCLVVSAGVWAYGGVMLVGDVQGAFYSVTIVAGLVVPQLPRHRVAAAVGVVGYVAAVGAVGVVALPGVDNGDVIANVIVPAGFTAIVIGLMFPNKGFYDMVAELEQARDRDAELAVVRERMRFASDLHDIQGHTLHVVKLKIALAQKLIHSDTARAERELREVHALVGDTLDQTRELAYGQRTLNLSAELENARHLLEAVGINVHVDRSEDVGTCANELLAQVLRETTTNILRHSRARTVRISLSENSISVVNDGASHDELPELRGLSALARRVSDEHGELTVAVEDGRFRTAAVFPPDVPADPPTRLAQHR